MPDENNTADKGTANPLGESKTGSENTGQDGGGSKDTDKSADKGEDKGSEKAKAPDKSSQDDDAEPQVKPRMSKKDFIIQRQQKKIEKLKSKTASEVVEEEKSDEDDEVAPEDEALITKVVAKQFAPILDKSMAVEDEKEIAEFVSANPDFKPYEAKAKKYMAHPSRRHLPVETIFYELAGKDLLKLGAERARKADEEAKHTQTGGGSAGGVAKAKNAFEMTKEEFEAEQERIRRSQ
jgi:hypothetical protein